ncbi:MULTISPECIES: hypothetical protein [unclassified Micromonospora]|uniref:hypothetical protein n=1 Tax=unclassified Micromonospora TaxID=2617518 RepID=UPI00098D0823|nr:MULTISPECIES: hypothetical protein [unclassified Micromonospora]MDI5937190.1 hypothetical protein [Micromonospora sp. DH15]OON29739.1 hypothetical protein BSA16_19965 [Micromonospora sp. Rc5]
MAIQKRKKLVSFFEVRDEHGDPLTETVDWQDVLAEVAAAPLERREQKIKDIIHWAQVYPYDDAYHLVFARAREEAVSSLDRQTGEILDTEADTNKPWVEVSVISFLPETNRFGFVLGTGASPRASTLATWFNRFGSFQEAITIGPVLSRDVVSKINGAAEASLVRAKFDSHNATATEGSSLFGAKHLLQAGFGDVEVELVIKVKGRISERREEERHRLASAAQDLIGKDFKRAVAQIVTYDDDGNPHREDVDFLHNRITKRKYIDVTDEEGRSVRIKSAVQAINQAADALKADLYDLDR